MEEINKIIGKNLLKLRKEAKLTQMELAEKFNYSDKSISKWENGESLPSIDVLYEIAKFYNTSLDALTSETGEAVIKKVKEKAPKLFSPKLIIPLLAVAAIWAVATTIFVILKLTLNINYPMCFMWAWPASFITITVFIAVWGHSKELFASISVLMWSLLVCIHLQLLTIHINIWPVYFLGIPLQVVITLCDFLVRKPKGYYKKLKEEKKKQKEAAKQKLEDN